MNLLDTEIAPLGMGCWPIGGPFFRGDQPLGYANAEDGESLRAIHAALDAGVTLFDTAAVYGAGHAERLLGQALARHPEAMIVSKIGIGFDEDTKQVTGEETDPAEVMPAIERCLKRLQRDRIDILLLHLNALPVARAEPIFAAMEDARRAGKIRAFGWSTDFPESARAMAGQEGFVGIEHAMNVFVDVPTIQGVAESNGLAAFIRSPLAMGVLTGKYGARSRMPKDDIRATDEVWRDYFHDARVKPTYLEQLDAVRELLRSGGRSLAQGALCWLLAKSDRNIPLPGARTAAQMEDNAGALDHGKLPEAVMAEIETLLTREAEGVARER